MAMAGEANTIFDCAIAHASVVKESDSDNNLYSSFIYQDCFLLLL